LRYGQDYDLWGGNNAPNGVIPWFAPEFADDLDFALWAMNYFYGLKPQVNAGYRTAADQADEQKNKQEGKNPNSVAELSDHQLGTAVDLQPSSTLNTQSPMFQAVKELMESLGFEWQGEKDRPHFFKPNSLTPRERESMARRIENFFKRCVDPTAQ